MNLESIDFTKGNPENLTGYDEFVRLYNEILPKPPHTAIDVFGKRVDIPEKKGIDLRTCSLSEAVNYLADTRIKKSEVIVSFIHRILAVRFKDEYSQIKDKINNRFKMEFELIQAHSKNDLEWIGEVGFSQKTRLDQTLINPKNIAYKDKQGNWKIKRK